MYNRFCVRTVFRSLLSFTIAVGVIPVILIIDARAEEGMCPKGSFERAVEYIENSLTLELVDQAMNLLDDIAIECRKEDSYYLLQAEVFYIRKRYVQAFEAGSHLSEDKRTLLIPEARDLLDNFTLFRFVTGSGEDVSIPFSFDYDTITGELDLSELSDHAVTTWEEIKPEMDRIAEAGEVHIGEIFLFPKNNQYEFTVSYNIDGIWHNNEKTKIRVTVRDEVMDSSKSFDVHGYQQEVVVDIVVPKLEPIYSVMVSSEGNPRSLSLNLEYVTGKFYPLSDAVSSEKIKTDYIISRLEYIFPESERLKGKYGINLDTRFKDKLGNESKGMTMERAGMFLLYPLREGSRSGRMIIFEKLDLRLAYNYQFAYGKGKLHSVGLKMIYPQHELIGGLLTEFLRFPIGWLRVRSFINLNYLLNNNRYVDDPIRGLLANSSEYDNFITHRLVIDFLISLQINPKHQINWEATGNLLHIGKQRQVYTPYKGEDMVLTHSISLSDKFQLTWGGRYKTFTTRESSKRHDEIGIILQMDYML